MNDLLSKIYAINTELAPYLDVQEIDFEKLQGLIRRREQLIEAFLNSVDSDIAKQFAQKELPFQKRLSDTFNKSLDNSKKELSKRLTARKLVANYK